MSVTHGCLIYILYLSVCAYNSLIVQTIYPVLLCTVYIIKTRKGFLEEKHGCSVTSRSWIIESLVQN